MDERRNGNESSSSGDLLSNRSLAKAVDGGIIDANFEMVNMIRFGQPITEGYKDTRVTKVSYLRYELTLKNEIIVGKDYRLFILNCSNNPNELRIILSRRDPTVKKEKMKDEWDQRIQRKNLEKLFNSGDLRKGIGAFLKGCVVKDISKYEYFNFSDTG